MSTSKPRFFTWSMENQGGRAHILQDLEHHHKRIRSAKPSVDTTAPKSFASRRSSSNPPKIPNPDPQAWLKQHQHQMQMRASSRLSNKSNLSISPTPDILLDASYNHSSMMRISTTSETGFESEAPDPTLNGGLSHQHNSSSPIDQRHSIIGNRPATTIPQANNGTSAYRRTTAYGSNRIHSSGVVNSSNGGGAKPGVNTIDATVERRRAHTSMAQRERSRLSPVTLAMMASSASYEDRLYATQQTYANAERTLSRGVRSSQSKRTHSSSTQPQRIHASDQENNERLLDEADDDRFLSALYSSSAKYGSSHRDSAKETRSGSTKLVGLNPVPTSVLTVPAHDDEDDTDDKFLTNRSTLSETTTIDYEIERVINSGDEAASPRGKLAHKINVKLHDQFVDMLISADITSAQLKRLLVGIKRKVNETKLLSNLRPTDDVREEEIATDEPSVTEQQDAAGTIVEQDKEENFRAAEELGPNELRQPHLTEGKESDSRNTDNKTTAPSEYEPLENDDVFLLDEEGDVDTSYA